MRKYSRVQCEPRGFPQLIYILSQKSYKVNKIYKILESTFAWFTVEASVGNKAISSYDTVTTVNVDDFQKTISNVTVEALEVKTFTVTTEGNKKLELAYYDSTITTAPKLRTGNLDQAGNKFLPYATANAAQDAENNTLFATVEVVIGMKSGTSFTDNDSNGYTREFIISQLTDKKIDITFTANGRARVYKTDASEVDDETKSNAVTISNVKLVTDTEHTLKATGSCKMYVWGGSITEGSVLKDTTENITQGLSVSASASHS